ncbi:hypothetical protein HYC85_029004 [Camellia sinensis]|uniref:Uncharacterized protein n=1 Tax=Camellia sinensis TaxID=4442 RepID=A0A7J7FWR4_CAMSI|nr:hypothetical protein HYC85_029004 [Camellia sinensis]
MSEPVVHLRYGPHFTAYNHILPFQILIIPDTDHSNALAGTDELHRGLAPASYFSDWHGAEERDVA